MKENKYEFHLIKGTHEENASDWFECVKPVVYSLPEENLDGKKVSELAEELSRACADYLLDVIIEEHG